jgi:serine protease inhibitor
MSYIVFQNMKTRTNLKHFLCLVFVLSIGLCSIARADAPSLGTQKVVAGNTEFALNLFHQLQPRAGNLCFSPYSISTALTMTYSGARNETARQMAQTLHFNLSPDKLPPAFAALIQNLDAIQQKGDVQLAVANSLWPQKGYPFLPDYLNLCRENYDTTIQPVDYREHTEAARKIINDWVADKTNQKIVDLLARGTIGRSTRLILVNAIYFKGNWANPFETRLTKDEPFHLSAEKTRTAPLMQQTHNFGYAEFPGLQVLELPYAGNDLSMLVLLPREVNGLGDLEAKLTVKNLAAWTANLPRQKVKVFLPKFKLTSKFSLSGTLAAMGMPAAFNPRKADFSGMDGRTNLFISAVIHQAFVKVNEQGTEAAAATAVAIFGNAITENPPPIPVFRADHPFLFLIRDNRNGAILFLGRVTNPVQ